MAEAIRTEQDNREYEPVNANEELVKENVAAMMEYMEDMCRCDKCYSDVCALVLNQVQPQYVTTRRGAVLSKLSVAGRDQVVDLTVKVINALNMVKNNPHH